jgi:hypothetical protein
MTDARVAFVHEAELQLHNGTDPAAVGAAVTTELCGHSEHEGPCRWPHNNDIELSDHFANFRTLFVAPSTEEDDVRERIERSLREGVGWAVLRTQSRPVSRPEEPLARRLATTPST